MRIVYHFMCAWFGLLLCSAQSLAIDSTPTLSTSSLNSYRHFDMASDFYLGAIGFKEAQDESQLVQLSVRPKAQYNLTPEFGVRGDAQLNLTTGRSQTRFQNPNFNLINVMELAAFYEPAPEFQVMAGAINQAHFDNRMFIADRGFPGVRLQSQWGNEKLSVTPKAQYVIPTSTSFEADRTEAEPLPSLTTIGVEAQWQVISWLDFSANVSQFQYQDLPSIVAFQSSRLGNSVIGTDPSESFFRYQFEGLTQSYQVAWDYLPQWGQEVQIGLIDNNEAPADRRRSQWVGTKMKFNLTDVSLHPEYAVFFAESDSVPALYSGFELGRSNRDGQFYGMTVYLKKLDVSIKAHFVDARQIERRPLQADMQIFDLALEFNNVSL